MVGVAPPVYRPVELTPSPALSYRSNFTATLFAMPLIPPAPFGSAPYPSPPPEEPRAVGELPCSTKVIPSADGFVSWNEKSVVKRCTLTAVVANALDDCHNPPLVS